jgi:superfamily I DNA and RNA helicase
MAMEFLPTVSSGDTPGEHEVWNRLKEALRDEEGVAFAHYPVFPKEATWRYEPDVLILHRRIGLVVIEVKDCRADNVEAIAGWTWQMTNWHSPTEAPAQQADKQLFALRRFFQGYPHLAERLRMQALVALPYVTDDEWAAKGFTGLPHHGRIIHQNQLSPMRLKRRLFELTRGDTQPLLSDEDWALACQVLGLRPALEREAVAIAPSGNPLVDRIRMSEATIPILDLEQLKIGLEIPPGPQRLRGIAGSGKTLLLAMKAARMHLSHPDWDIAFTFNTKSLYQAVRGHIERFCRHFGDCEPDWDKLRVLHGWGGRFEPGLYSTLAEAAGHPARSVGWAKERNRKGSPGDHFGAVCQDLVESGRIQPVFDAILIDEGQDFAAEVYQMAYAGLREPKRLIWAYDEAQSLDSLRIPNAEKLFGRDEDGKLKVDLVGYYPGGIQKSRIMRKCYRTPVSILMTGHALGMGLLRPAGPVQLITTQQGWQDIGYDIEGAFDQPGKPITLSRPRAHRPHPLDKGAGTPDLLRTAAFPTREAELNDCAVQLAQLAADGVSMDDALVVFPGNYWDKADIERDMGRLAAKLAAREIKAHLAEGSNDSAFRQKGAVTLSRIHRAKGNEAAFVFVVGLDRLAETEGELESRNQLFVALTRARGTCRVSGYTPAGDPLFEELKGILAAGDRLTFQMPVAGTVREEHVWHEPSDPAPVLPFVTHLPFFDLPVAAGRWPAPWIPELDSPHWIDASELSKLHPNWFAVRITGKSMEPRIPDGAIAVFQRVQDLPQGKVVLAGLAEDGDPDGAAAWVVKRLVVQEHAHGGVEYRLRSENRDFEDIPVGPEAGRLRVQGVLKHVLHPRG